MFWIFKRFQNKPDAVQPAVLPSVSAAKQIGEFREQIHPYRKEFDREIESWCYGLTRLPERPFPKVVFRIIRELEPIMARALAQGYVFDIQSVADKVCVASRGVVEQKSLVFALLAVLPEPEKLPLEQKRLYAMIVAQVEASHGGAVNRVRQRMSRSEKPANESSTDLVLQSPTHSTV